MSCMYHDAHVLLVLLKDFGASVVRVDKPNQPPLDTLARYVCAHEVTFFYILTKDFVQLVRSLAITFD